MDKESGNSRNRIGGMWTFFFLVLTIGLISTAFGVSVGAAASARVPFTEINISIGGSLGKKEAVRSALPPYVRDRIADNNTLFNQSVTLTIWLAEGIGVIVFGEQPEAPVVDLKVNLIR